MVKDFLNGFIWGKCAFHFSYGRKHFFLHDLLALWAMALWAEHKQGSLLLLNCQEFLPSGNQDSGEQKGVSNKHQLQQKLLSFQPTFGLHDKAKGMVQDVKSCAVQTVCC